MQKSLLTLFSNKLLLFRWFPVGLFCNKIQYKEKNYLQLICL